MQGIGICSCRSQNKSRILWKLPQEEVQKDWNYRIRLLIEKTIETKTNKQKQSDLLHTGQECRKMVSDEKKRGTGMKNEPNKELLEATETWKALERKTVEQRKAADAYYEETLMAYIEAAFIENNQSKVYEKVEYLIMSVGTSFEPLVLDIRLNKPKKILFLYTEKSAAMLDKIVNYCNLSMKDIEKKQVNEVEPLDIYREIKAAYLQWGKPEKLYIDISGGTKAMSAAAAMAGAVIDVQLLYVGSEEYLVDFRKPNPGSETLYYISNPLAVFGDLEIEKAFALFAQHNYAGASDRLEELKESVPDPELRQQLDFVYLLGRTYENWDALEFGEAYSYIRQLGKKLRRDKKLHSTFWLMDHEEQIGGQQQMLERLSQIPELLYQKKQMEVLQNLDYIVPLMFTMYQSAMVREEQEKYDMATLLLYRLLEMIEQRRLSKSQLYVSDMRYEELAYDCKQTPELQNLTAQERQAWLREEVNGIKQQLFRKAGSSYLPDQISLLEGYILLLALKDPISLPAGTRPIDRLKHIRAMVRLRNNSIFAHGLGAVSLQDYMKFRNFVKQVFREFCDIEGVAFDKWQQLFSWINPMESSYYAGMEGN